MLKVGIYITLKKTVADPQGLVVKHALESLGYKDIDDVRIGKLITITLRISDKIKAKRQLDEMCRKFLANPIIEDYHFKITEIK